MNPVLFCLLVLTLGSLAVKVSTADDKSENAESLEKKSSEFSSVSEDTSLIARLGVGKHNSGRWRKVNSSPVCFGARNHQFGRFYIRSSGKLASVLLVHLYGYVTCDTRHISYWSYWGCGSYYSGDKINVVITTGANHILLPPGQFMVHHGAKWSKIPGYDSLSPELVLSFFNPYWVYSGQQLRLWYGEDLMNVGEGDNGGRACFDTYALYI